MNATFKSTEQYGLEKLFERIEEISVHNVKVIGAF